MLENHSLSKISLAITLSVMDQFAFADISTADSNTQLSKQKGIEIINIANPSSTGLSHNRYNKFNVDKAGAVLNNARQAGISQLAGDLPANPNLATQSAQVILNEVVSRNASKIAGQQEIFGQKADYVLANPNGISIEGGGFINTARASLVVGKAHVEEDRLKEYDVTGNNSLTTNGKFSASGDVDLIAPQVIVDGKVATSEGVNVIAGRNKLARDNSGKLTITTVEQTGKVLDGKVVGSMQAGRIRIYSTDERATISAQSANLDANSIEIVSANAKFSGEITREGEYKTGSNGVDNRRVKVEEAKDGYNERYQATRLKTDELTVNVYNKLEIAGADIQAKNAQILAGSVNLSAEKTVNVSNQTKNQSKGLWYRNEQDSSRTEVTHQTTINAENVSIQAKTGKLKGEGVKITANNVALYGDKGISLQGVKSTTTQSKAAQFKNETAQLKTGTSNQSIQSQKYTATELNTNNLVLGSRGDMVLKGVVASVDGDFFAKNCGTLKFDAEKSTDIYNVNDDMKFWGGLAGANTIDTAKNTETVNGSDFTIKGSAMLDAYKGVTISASRVISAGEGIVRGNAGALIIDSVQATNTTSDYTRQGTVFNITKARSNNFTQTSTSTASTLKSESNLELSSYKNVSIVGSNVQSDGLLEIAARSGIEIKGAINYANIQNSSAGFKLSSGFDNLNTVLQYGHASANLSVNNRNGTPEVNSDVRISKNKQGHNFKIETKFNFGLNVYNNSNSSQMTTHTAATVSGSNVELSAKNITISGSRVAATAGDLNINANTLKTKADIDRKVSNSVKNELNIGVRGSLDQQKLSGTLGITYDHLLNTATVNTAQVSELSASNDVNLAACHRIEHQGSRVKAGENIREFANKVLHTTAKDNSIEFGNNANVSLILSANIDRSKAFGVGANLSANGGRKNSSTMSHTATQFQSGKNISVSACNLQDNATKYNAGETALFNSRSHRLNAVVNHSESDKLSAGARIGASAHTRDFQTINARVDVGANYSQSTDATDTAMQGSITAKNVNIHTGKLISQANIKASEDVSIQAQTAKFSQASNKRTSKGSGFDVALGVNAMIVPSAGAATITSVDIGLTANGNKQNQSQAVTSTISGRNVDVETDGLLSLQATNVQSIEDTNLLARRVNITSGENHNHNVSARVATNIGAGKKIQNTAFSGNVNVNRQNNQESTSVMVGGKNVNIQSQNGVYLNDVSFTSQNLNFDTGKGTLSQTVSKAENKGFAGNFSLGRKDNQLHADFMVNSKNVNIQAKNGLNLKDISSTSQNVNLVTGKGNLVLTASKDSANKTDLSAKLNLLGGIIKGK